MSKIVLFYKRLVKPGGAERLLLKEYQYFKSSNYDTKIVCFEYNQQLEFNEFVDSNDIISFENSSDWNNILDLSNFMKKNQDAKYICNSGYIDFYLASAFTKTNYSLHIHQPSFMSFNEKDKYSIFMKDAFSKLVNSNHGAKRFVDIKSKLTFLEKIKLNLRALISIKAVKKAENVFVLSDFAVREKKIMYGINAYNFTGALEKKIFDYEVKPLNKYENYKYKLISIARLDINKRFDELIIGFADFLKEEPSSILLIGGTGDQFDNLNKLVNKLKIEDNVKLIGFVPDELLYDYYAWADLFVSIDWADFRITSYEAMAVGTKVLLSDETDPNKELLTSGYYYLTKPKVSAVKDAIKNALEKTDVIDKSSLDALLKNYVWESYFSKIEKVV